MPKTRTAAGAVTREKVLDFVTEYINENGVPPSMRKIMLGTGLKTTSHVTQTVNALAEQGAVIRGPEGEVIPAWLPVAIAEYWERR